MKYKDILKKLESLENDFAVYKENVRKRDYLVRTNFVGELKNKKLIKELESEVVWSIYWIATT